MKRAPITSRRAGVTLIELLIVVGLAAVVLGKVGMLMLESNKVMRSGSSEMALEDHARKLLDQIAMSIMACDRDALAPILTPGHSTGVRYQVSLGVADGETVWSDPEEVELVQENGQFHVTWVQRPGAVDERRVVWSRRVEELLEGEEVNGVDDNGNGLTDEEGLNFVVEGNQVTIRISLGTFLDGEQRVTRSLETIVTVRNNPQ